jgi:hypothetical protein
MSALFRHAAWLAAVVLLAVPARAQDTHGDVFGDLYHILRSPSTGQPILQKRDILLAGDIPGIGYCPIPVDINGAEIPFLDLSCEVDPTQASRLIEVDYFGRLSAGRTRETNMRMHFDEVIDTILEAHVVTLDPAGRLQFGTNCTSATVCVTWKVIDSPLENLAFYHRVMKYGHIQTDPLEEDTSFHGDPALGTVYHPALRAEDWAKFTGVVTALLPRASANQCFSGTTFETACALPQSLTAEDFVRSASFLGGASDKTGRMSMDLIQYFNRILKITQATALTAATLNTLPALIRDENGIVSPAAPGLPAPADELFVDYAPAAYNRNDRFNTTAPSLVSAGVGLWSEDAALPLLPFLDFVFGPAPPATGINAFIMNSADAQRAIEFIHNYEIPANLYAIYAAVTFVTVAPQTVLASMSDQNVTLSATVTNSSPVNDGTVTFTVKSADGLSVIGVPVVSGTVTNGAASATYVLPGGTPPGNLQILAEYSGAFGFKPGSGIGTLTVSPDAPVGLLVLNGTGSETSGVVSFELQLAAASVVPVAVQYATSAYTASAPVDYTHTTGIASFAPGTTSVTVTVPVVDDVTPEPDESFSLVLSAPSNAVLVKSIATGVIEDNDGNGEPVLDFNQDGFTDLVWQHTDGRVSLWYMNGLTLVSSTAAFPQVADLDWEIRAVGDFNGDWKPDLIWQHRGSGALAAWFVENGTFTATPFLTTVSGGTAEPDLAWKIMGAADMNRDTQLDLIWQNETTGELRIWHMNGIVQMDSVTLDLDVAGTDWKIVGVADMNGDGWNDLVWREQTLGGLAAWMMQDAQTLVTLRLTPDAVANTAWRLAGVRDMNGDGLADLVWQNSDTGSLAAWLMNGLVMSATPALTPNTILDLNWKIVGVR